MSSNYIASRPDFDHMVYLRLTEACNAVCDHCFIPVNPRSMGIEDAEKVSRHIRQIAKSGDKVFIQFHGGLHVGFGEIRPHAAAANQVPVEVNVHF